MAKPNEVIKIKIEEIIKLIDGYNSTWPIVFQNFLNKMPEDKNSLDFARDIMGLYQGGMGSFADLVLQKDGKMPIDDNDRLENLRHELYRLCEDLLHENHSAKK